MTLSRIEMDTMTALISALSDVPNLLAVQEKQAESLERIAKQLEDLMGFLQGTTIEQVEEKREEMRNKNQRHNKSEKRRQKKSVDAARKFVEEMTGE